LWVGPNFPNPCNPATTTRYRVPVAGHHLVYRLRKPTLDGRTELILTPLELLDRLAYLVTPPRVHKHRYCRVLAPNAKLRKAVTATAGPAGAMLQVLEEARRKMGLEEAGAEDDGPRLLSSDEGERRSPPGKIAARCWALLLVRIFEYLPLVCPRCGEPMRLIVFILDPPLVERILGHIGEPTDAPAERRGRRLIRPVAATTAGGETRGMARIGASVSGLSAGGGGVCPEDAEFAA